MIHWSREFTTGEPVRERRAYAVLQGKAKAGRDSGAVCRIADGRGWIGKAFSLASGRRRLTGGGLRSSACGDGRGNPPAPSGGHGDLKRVADAWPACGSRGYLHGISSDRDGGRCVQRLCGGAAGLSERLPALPDWEDGGELLHSGAPGQLGQCDHAAAGAAPEISVDEPAF